VLWRYLLILLRNGCHGVAVYVRTWWRSQAVFVDIQHGSSVHHRVPANSYTVLNDKLRLWAATAQSVLQSLGWRWMSVIMGSVPRRGRHVAPCLVSSGYRRRERPGLKAHYVPPLSTLRIRGTVPPFPPILYVSVAFVRRE